MGIKGDHLKRPTKHSVKMNMPPQWKQKLILFQEFKLPLAVVYYHLTGLLQCLGAYHHLFKELHRRQLSSTSSLAKSNLLVPSHLGHIHKHHIITHP